MAKISFHPHLPHVVQYEFDCVGALISLKESLSSAISGSYPQARVFIDNAYSNDQNIALKIPMSDSLPWSLVLNDLQYIWPNFETFLSPALDEIISNYRFGEYYFELVLFAGENSNTPFGFHVDPQNMRAYHFQISGSKTFEFNLSANVKFGQEMSKLNTKKDCDMKLSNGQIGYLPTIYPHRAIYENVSVSIALAVWKRSIGEQVDFFIRKNEMSSDAVFEEYKNAFFTESLATKDRVISALNNVPSTTVPRQTIEWFEK